MHEFIKGYIKVGIFLLVIFVRLNTFAEIPLADTSGTSNNQIIKEAKLYNNELTGNWFGVRNLLIDQGIEFGINYTGDFFSNLSEQKSYYLDNFLINLNINTEKIFGIKNTMLYASVLGNEGGKPNECTNSIQGVNNIETYSTWKLYELQFRADLPEDNLFLLIGLYDLNSEFDVRENSSVFINPSQGIGIDLSQSGKNGPPIFPNTSLAVKFALKPSDILTIQAAAFDGVPGHPGHPDGTHIHLMKGDGYLLISEADLDLCRFNMNRLFNLKLGYWYYAEQPLFSPFKNEIEPLIEYNNYGFYVSTEANLTARNGVDSCGLGYFLRTGFANPNLNKIEYYLGAGLIYKSLFKDHDVLGIAIASGFTGKNYNDYLNFSGVQPKPYETDIELTYCTSLYSGLTLQPDLQLMINPLGLEEKTSHLYGGLRLNLNL